MGRTDHRLACIILAAGQGKRMRSKRAKVLHAVAGRPMIEYVLDVVEFAGAGRILAVIGPDGRQIRKHLAESKRACRERIEWVTQKVRRGTGDAVRLTARSLDGFSGTVMILNGDHPLLRPETLRHLLKFHRKQKAGLTLLTACLDSPQGYGRILRDSTGRLRGIVEDRDATEEQREITEINTGVVLAQPEILYPLLQKIRPDNAQGEYYLTDTVRQAIGREAVVQSGVLDDPAEGLGINTRAELSRAERIVRRRKAEQLMEEGVTLLDPDNTWIDPPVAVGRDTIIHPFTAVGGKTVIGEDCIIGAHVRIEDSVLGKGVLVRDHCVVTDSVVEDAVRIGPFAHLRPGTVLRRDARVGNFVEIKKSVVGAGAKANHLTYLGDATVGRESNIGAGTITCNYDGTKKSKTVIGEKVFVGSTTQFVAPVKVGRGATIAAGSTITQDVPAGSLAIGRARQVNKPRKGLKKAPARSRAGGPKRKKRKGT